VQHANWLERLSIRFERLSIRLERLFKQFQEGCLCLEPLPIRLSRPRVGRKSRSTDDGTCNWRFRGGSITRRTRGCRWGRRRGRRLGNLVKNSSTSKQHANWDM
jgi:hypothetical protein